MDQEVGDGQRAIKCLRQRHASGVSTCTCKQKGGAYARGSAHLWDEELVGYTCGGWAFRVGRSAHSAHRLVIRAREAWAQRASNGASGQSLRLARPPHTHADARSMLTSYMLRRVAPMSHLNMCGGGTASTSLAQQQVGARRARFDGWPTRKVDQRRALYREVKHARLSRVKCRKSYVRCWEGT